MFNNEEVVSHFHLRIWVSVSDDFDIKQLLVKLIKSITNENCSDLDVEQLQMHLRGHLHNRKFLLVLDDVWNENQGKWIKLRNFLMEGTKWK